MTRTLSQDLRDRVVASIDGGLSCRSAAARLGVSVSSEIRWRDVRWRMASPWPSHAAVTDILARSRPTAASFAS